MYKKIYINKIFSKEGVNIESFHEGANETIMKAGGREREGGREGERARLFSAPALVRVCVRGGAGESRRREKRDFFLPQSLVHTRTRALPVPQGLCCFEINTVGDGRDIRECTSGPRGGGGEHAGRGCQGGG